MRALPSQDVLGPLGQHTVEPHGSHDIPDVIRINQRGVTEHLGLLAEQLLDLPRHPHRLLPEAVLVGQRGKAMGIRLGQELHTPSLVQFLQKLDDRRGVVLQQLNRASGNGERHLEESGVVLGHLEQGLQGRNVGLLRRRGDALLVLVVVVVVMVRTDVKEAVTFQMYILMNLKIKANRFHVLGF